MFTKFIGMLILWVYQREGWELTLGEALRSKLQAAANAQSGAGIVNSLHILRLAIDLELFINGLWQQDTEAYKAMGDYWKTLHPLCRWGGDFHTRPDGNHFSMEHEGVK
jgi:hypothetical protein